MPKVVTTDQLKTAIAVSATADLRVLPAAVVAKLDPDGKHVLGGLVLLHDDRSVRLTHCLFKLRGRNEPLVSAVEIELSAFNRLPDYAEAR